MTQILRKIEARPIVNTGILHYTEKNNVFLF